MRREGCPRKIWLDDLGNLIKGHIDKGEQVVLLTDINEDVESNNIKQWADSLSINEIVSTTTDRPTATHN